jgi:hypothetical protein
VQPNQEAATPLDAIEPPFNAFEPPIGTCMRPTETRSHVYHYTTIDGLWGILNKKASGRQTCRS